MKVFKLMKGFITGNIRKVMLPLNLIKNYFGEKYGFECTYLIHYQAWLIFPGFWGLLLTLFQIWRFFKTQDIIIALDTPFNSIYGLFVCFWATVFVESWKRTEATIQHIWNCSDNSMT